MSNRLMLLGLIFALPAAVMGQVNLGSIDGTIRDGSGGVLPGATLVLTSPELPGGPQMFTTNNQGRYRFRNLPPGDYQLTIEMPGFATYREEGLIVTVGGNVERNVEMSVASVAETITVTGESPIVDTRKSGLSTNYDDTMMENVPLRRFSMFDFTKSAPGMSATNPTSGTSTRVSAYGSNTDENTYLMDGTDFTAPVSGAAWPWPDTDTIEEIEIISLGASAEYQVGGGAVFNAISRQGTNDVRVDAAYFGMSEAITSKPIKRGCGGCPDGDENGETGFTRDKYIDFTTHVGAPIVKDKAWIYAGYQYLRDYDNQPGTDPRFPRQFEADRINWKFTWQITENMKFMHTYHDDYWVIPQTPSISSPFETTLTWGGRNPSITFGNITHVLSQNTFYDVRVSGFYSPDDYARPNGNFGQSRRTDSATGETSGGPPFSGGFRQARTAVHGKLSHYASDWIGADHDFKFGVQYVVGQHSGHYGYTNDIIYYDYNGAPDYAYIRERYNYGGKFTDLGFFVEDMVHIGDRATVQIGVRYDRVEAISQDVQFMAQDDRGVIPVSGQEVTGLGPLYTNNNIAPRIGFNVKLDNEGKTVLRGNWGLYFRQPITGEIAAVHPGNTTITTAFFDPATGAYTDIVDVFDPLVNIGVASDTLSARTSQFSIGLDREVTNDIAVGFTYIRKDGSNYNGWITQNALYEPGQVTLDDGSLLDVFNITTDPSDRFYLLGNCPCGPESMDFPNFFMDIDGLEFKVTKRMANNWQALVSYNYSHARGLMGHNYAGPSSSQESRVRSGAIGRDPNQFTNAEGNLLNDRTHTFILTGTYEFPGIELLIGANYRYFTGKPWASQARPRLPQGRQTIYLEPLGSRRLSSQNNLDLRVSKIFRFGEAGKFELFADILNVLNETAEEDIASRNAFSSNLGEGNRWVDPRRAFIGVKVAY